MVADETVGKRHWVVRLGRRRASYVYTGMVICVYVSLLVSVFGGWLPQTAMVPVLTLPLAVFAVKTALRHHDDPSLLVPANASTVLLHLLAGLLLALGLALDSFLSGSLI